MNTDLAEMFRYNAWANRELFEACCSLTDEQLDRQIQGISGSVRELLMHIAGGQQTFVLRTKGRQHEGELGRQSEWPGIESPDLDGWLYALSAGYGQEITVKP